VNDLCNDKPAAVLFRNKEVYENEENGHEKFKNINVNSATNSEFLEQSMNRMPAKNVM
jgi:hypothetical protein